MSDQIKRLLVNSRTILVIGLSSEKGKPSSKIADFLDRIGYEVIPVNPRLTEWNNRRVYMDVSELPEAVDIDIANFFIPSQIVPDVVKRLLERPKPPKAIWLQEGITSDEARKLAEQRGVFFVQDRCIYKEYIKHFGFRRLSK